jgi:hypothetical protein
MQSRTVITVGLGVKVAWMYIMVSIVGIIRIR